MYVTYYYKFKIVTLNVRGLGDPVKCRHLFYYLNEKQFDIILLQETHSTKTQEGRWKNEWGGRMWFSHGESRARGTALLVNRKFNLKMLDIIRDQYGRYLLAKVEKDGERLLIGNVYGPNLPDQDFYSSLFAKVKQIGCDRCIIAGDFTVALNYELDRTKKVRHPNYKAGKVILYVMENLDLIDVWREIHPWRNGFTWRRRTPFLAERLDYFLMAASMHQFVQNIEVLPSTNSDHSLICLKLGFNVHKKGPGFWKFNNSLLYDLEYLDKINKLLDCELAQEKCYTSKRDHWEIIKLAIRNSTLQYSARKQKSSRNKLAVLERKLLYWQDQADTGIYHKVDERVEQLRKEVNLIKTEKAKGAIMRCRKNWHELAEKPTKYFLNLEKSNFNKKNSAPSTNSKQEVK